MKVETWCIRLLIFVTNVRLNSPTLSRLYVISKDFRGNTPDPVTKVEEQKVMEKEEGKAWDEGKGPGPPPQLKFRGCAPGKKQD
jgi:hypothetical protein